MKKTGLALLVVFLAWIPVIYFGYSLVKPKITPVQVSKLPVWNYDEKRFSEIGIASWYGPGFHGKKRADGKRYDMYQISVAHKFLPLGTELRITNLSNLKTIRARVNDRGPYVKGREIDLSLAAAKKLGAVKPGLIPVRITVLS